MRQHRSVRTVLVAALVVALVTVASIYSLSRWAGQSAGAELALVSLKGELQALSAYEGHSIASQSVDAELARAIARADQRIAGQRRALQEGPAADDLATLWTLLDQYRSALGHQSSLIEAGDAAAAHDHDERVLDPLFDQLEAEIDRQAQANHDVKQRIGLVADLGMAASLLISAAVIGMLFTRFSAAQARQTADLERTLGELQRAQEQIVQSEKLAALGQLIAGIAHEINTPLGAIRAAAGNADKALRASLSELPKLNERLSTPDQAAFFGLLHGVLGRKAPVTAAEKRPLKRDLTRQLDAAGIGDARSLADLLTDIGVQGPLAALMPLLIHPQRDWMFGLAYDLTRLQSNAETILRAVERASKVVFALKSYARFDEGGEKRPVDLREGVETVLELYQNQLKQGIVVEREFAELPPVPGHADELVQVWTNLVHNAVQAMGGHGRLALSTSHEPGHAVVSITDSGPGIAAEIQARIFDPFFTTKPSGEGSGLGLHICRKIVAKHDGAIKVDSSPGRTTFSVWLPLAAAPAA